MSNAINSMQSFSNRAAWITGSAIIIAALLVAIALVHTIPNTHSAPENTEPTFLYIQNATSGSLVPDEDKETWTLTLLGASEHTVFFSDRPHREVGRESTASFIHGWDQGEGSFEVVPPNAALDIFHDDGTQSVLILELLDATYNQNTNTLVYDVLPLSDTNEAFAQFESFGQSALFIDSTYKHYHCGCELAEDEEDCQCKYEYKLGHGETKEFRVSCTETAQQDIAITHRKKDTTCTIDFSTGAYKTKSCTNWRTSGHDNVTVKAICNDDVE